MRRCAWRGFAGALLSEILPWHSVAPPGSVAGATVSVQGCLEKAHTLTCINTEHSYIYRNVPKKENPPSASHSRAPQQPKHRAGLEVKPWSRRGGCSVCGQTSAASTFPMLFLPPGQSTGAVLGWISSLVRHVQHPSCLGLLPCSMKAQGAEVR